MKISKRITALFLCMAMAVACSFNLVTNAAEANQNKFNVVIVLDASHSVANTDPNGLRYEAIEQFVGLLAEKGNYLGSVVFSDGIEAEKKISLIDGQEDKAKVIKSLKSVKPLHYTNIGAALSRATEMLDQNGDENLPSVIILVSDGNTEMKNEKELKKSKALKADAIEDARDKKIKIYSVCLNANNKADFSEMKQISKATGGVAKEIKKADDLKPVLNMFYNVIYNTSTKVLVDEDFPKDGVIEKTFEIPPSGVDEVNIIISGNPKSYSLKDPDGKKFTDVKKYASKSFLLLKITSVKPGIWTFAVKGIAKEHIKINMVYNIDMKVDLKIMTRDMQDNIVNAGDKIRISASVSSADGLFSSEEYNGFKCVLNVTDDEGELVESVDMKLKDDRFVTDYTFDTGSYSLQAVVKGFDMELLSDKIEPVTAVEKEIVNTAPKAEKNPVSRTVYILPFTENRKTFDLSEIAKDAENDPLRYSILSSSFVEGEDYKLEGDKIIQRGFSLYKGSYDIRVTDDKGLYCDVELKVTSINVGILTLILLGIAALIVAAILGTLFYIAITKPFNGTITVSTAFNGVTSCQPRRGRCKLINFTNIRDLGLNLNKCYFQASGKDFVTLVTDVPVYSGGMQTKKIDIRNYDVTISLDPNYTQSFEAKFESFNQYGSSYRRRGNFLTDIGDFFSDLFGGRRR